MNAREKIIADNLEFCERFSAWLTEWETQFIASIKQRGTNLTAKQFNALQNVALRITKEVA